MISVIVPIYNSQKYLKRCLDSLNNQTTKSLEIVLVDDGSTDSCPFLLDSYKFKNAKKTVIHKKNGGLISAWKAGFLASSGDYIGFVDSDDFVEPKMFECMLEKAINNDADIVVCGMFHERKSHSEITLQPVNEGLYNSEILFEKIVPKLNSDYISPSRVNKIYKRNIINEGLNIVPDSITSGEDNFATFLWFLNSKRIYILNEPFYHYCENKDSMSFIYKPQIFDSYLTLVNGISEYNSIKGSPIQHHELANLYNFYGFVWCKYVCNSNLKRKVKKQELSRLYKTQEFKKALKFCEKGHFFRTIIYKLTISFHIPWLMMSAIKIMNRK